MERHFPKKGEYYRHFEGGRYVILALARESRTKEEMIVYQNADKEEEIFVCPTSVFLEKTDRETYENTGYEYCFVLETSKEEMEKGQSIIFAFLELSDAEEKIRFMQRHREDMTEEVLSVIAESLEFVESQKDTEFRYEAILDYLHTIARYEGRRG